MFKYVLFDPRPIPAATEANEKAFAAGPVYGVEVTVPALAARCIFNLDPQHAGQDATIAAIEAAVTTNLPSEGTTLATVRADLDAVGAMAVFSIRTRGESLESAMGRIAAIGAADKFDRGGWRPAQLPTTANPWPEGGQLAALGAAVSDFKIALPERVAAVERWLLTGEEPASYRSQVERERADLIRAIESGAIKASTVAGGRIAVVETTHRAATQVGYGLAPVVVARNPAFRLGGGEPHVKFTVCQFDGTRMDMRAVLAELAALESGWGGSPTIGGSPQGVSSNLTTDQVVAVVERHLK